MSENSFDLEKHIEREYRKSGIVRTAMILMFPIVVLLILYGINKTLPAGVQFRTAFYVVTCTVCFLVIFFDLIILAVLICRVVLSGWKKVLVTIAAVIIIILYILGGSFMLLLVVLDHDSEKVMADGRILVTEEHFIDPNTYYVAEPYHIFFRRFLYISDSEGHEFNLEENIYP